MKSLYVVSTDNYSGKSGFCLSLAKMLKRKGRKVAYMKPIGTKPTKVDGYDSCEDVDFIWKSLDKPGNISDICPIALLSDFNLKLSNENLQEYKEILLKAKEKISINYDIAILEGASTLTQGKFIGMDAGNVANLLDTPALLIAKYNDLLTVDNILSASEILGRHLIGVIINVVPHNELAVLKATIIPFLEKKGINVLGYLIDDKILSSVSVNEIADHLRGEILCAQDKADQLVESFMVGAMGQEQAISFFKKRANKAVVTGGDRSDVQLAALETSTKCLILTGNLSPRPLVLSRAEELGVPVILVHLDTLTAIEKAEELIGGVRVHEDTKVNHLTALINENIELEKIFKALT